VLPDFYVNLSSPVAGLKCLMNNCTIPVTYLDLTCYLDTFFLCFQRINLLGPNFLKQLSRILAGLDFAFTVVNIKIKLDPIYLFKMYVLVRIHLCRCFQKKEEF